MPPCWVHTETRGGRRRSRRAIEMSLARQPGSGAATAAWKHTLLRGGAAAGAWAGGGACGWRGMPRACTPRGALGAGRVGRTGPPPPARRPGPRGCYCREAPRSFRRGGQQRGMGGWRGGGWRMAWHAARPGAHPKGRSGRRRGSRACGSRAWGPGRFFLFVGQSLPPEGRSGLAVGTVSLSGRQR